MEGESLNIGATCAARQMYVTRTTIATNFVHPNLQPLLSRSSTDSLYASIEHRLITIGGRVFTMTVNPAPPELSRASSRWVCHSLLTYNFNFKYHDITSNN